MIFTSIIFLSLIFPQIIRYEISSIKHEIRDYPLSTYVSDYDIGKPIESNLKYKAVQIDDSLYLEAVVEFKSSHTTRLHLNHGLLPNGSKFFLFDIDKILLWICLKKMLILSVMPRSAIGNGTTI